MTESTNNTVSTLGPGGKLPDPKIIELPEQDSNLQVTQTQEDNNSIKPDAG